MSSRLVHRDAVIHVHMADSGEVRLKVIAGVGYVSATEAIAALRGAAEAIDVEWSKVRYGSEPDGK